jgi:hypothetical protein
VSIVVYNSKTAIYRTLTQNTNLRNVGESNVRIPTCISELKHARKASVVGQSDMPLTRACRARVTFSRISLAVFVQMKGLGASL